MSLTPFVVAEAYALATHSQLRPELDGSQGANRGLGRAQITANTDWDAIKLWLSQYKENTRTFDSYEKEVTRFYVWVLTTRQKPFSAVTFEDWSAYLAFVANPQPADEWVSINRSKRGSAQYRPFAGPLSPSSQRYAQTVLWSLFEWLRSVGYLAGNPIIIKRRRRQSDTRSISRALSAELWQTVLSTIEQYPRNAPVEVRRYAQARWLVSLFYFTGLRTSEACDTVMGAFFSLPDPQENCVRHFLRVIGKGDKERSVPVSDALASELSRYRQANKLSAWPSADDDTPLVFSLQSTQRLKPLTRQALYLQLKAIFKRAGESLDERSLAGARTLKEASTHWLRHTAATEMLNSGADLRTVQNVLGHASLATTGIYSHSERLRSHRDVSARQGPMWGREEPFSADPTER